MLLQNITKENPLNIITLCSGYDSQCLALKYSNIPFDLIAWSEFDPYSKKSINNQPAVIAHNTLFPEYSERNVGDMTKVDWSQFSNISIDILFYSTPCTSYSLAGNQTGGEKDSGTKSSILWYTENAISILRPKILIQENVKNLVSAKFLPEFNSWKSTVASYGYKNFYTVLNAKDFNVPQSRERLFMVSVRNDVLEESDEQTFVFPLGSALTTNLKNFLDEDSSISKKHYYSKERVDDYLKRLKENHNDSTDNKQATRASELKAEPLF